MHGSKRMQYSFIIGPLYDTNKKVFLIYDQSDKKISKMLNYR